MLDVEPARVAKFVIPVWPSFRDNMGVDVDFGDMAAFLVLAITTGTTGDS